MLSTPLGMISARVPSGAKSTSGLAESSSVHQTNLMSPVAAPTRRIVMRAAGAPSGTTKCEAPNAAWGGAAEASAGGAAELAATVTPAAAPAGLGVLAVVVEAAGACT